MRSGEAPNLGDATLEEQSLLFCQKRQAQEDDYVSWRSKQISSMAKNDKRCIHVSVLLMFSPCIDCWRTYIIRLSK